MRRKWLFWSYLVLMFIFLSFYFRFSSLRFSFTTSPLGLLKLLFVNTEIGKTGVETPADIVVTPEKILISSEGVFICGPGINVVIIDPNYGDVVKLKNFNLKKREEFPSFIKKIPPGYIVVITGKGEAFKDFSSREREVIRTLGGKGRPREEAGYAYALVGVKGAKSGTALEITGEEDRVFLWVGMF